MDRAELISGQIQFSESFLNKIFDNTEGLVIFQVCNYNVNKIIIKIVLYKTITMLKILFIFHNRFKAKIPI